MLSKAGRPFSRGTCYTVLKNPVYIAKVAHGGALHAAQHEAIVDHALWQQVQDQLARNRRNRASRTTAKVPSLLAGLLYDDRNNPMSPTHSRKANRRYRYYVSQAVLQFGDKQAGEVIRLPATTIEDLVVEQLQNLLRAAPELLDLLTPENASAHQQRNLIAAAQWLADDWAQLNPSEQIMYLRTLFHRVTVTRHRIDIAFSRAGLQTTLLDNGNEVAPPEDAGEDTYLVSVPVRLQRCGKETRLLVPNGESAPAHHTSTRAIQDALAKTLDWNEGLLSGSVSSMSQIAKREGFNQRYVAHLLKLAYLAPDIM